MRGLIVNFTKRKTEEINIIFVNHKSIFIPWKLTSFPSPSIYCGMFHSYDETFLKKVKCLFKFVNRRGNDTRKIFRRATYFNSAVSIIYNIIDSFLTL